MDLIKVMKTFSTQEDCIEYLERLRWKESPECPHCESLNVRRRNEHEIGRVGRWNCYDCRATFKVTHGTIFHGTKIPLQKWFLAIALMANAKKSLSSHQLARDLGVKQKAAWCLMMAIRTEMGKDNVGLQGALKQMKPISVVSVVKTMTGRLVNPINADAAPLKMPCWAQSHGVDTSSHNSYPTSLVRRSPTSSIDSSGTKILNSLPISIKATTKSVRK